jgi:hypothetical protein
MPKAIAATIVSIGACGLTAPAVAHNLLVDPGFNEGANGFQGWTVSGGVPLSLDNPSSYPGLLSVYFAPLPPSVPIGSHYALEIAYSGNTISQTVNLSPADVGKTLTLSLFFEDVGNDSPNESGLTLDVNGVTTSFSPVPNTLSQPYEYEIASVTTTALASNSVSISAYEQNNFYAYANPDLELSGVPEPATWTMMLIGLGGLGSSMRCHRRRALASA